MAKKRVIIGLLGTTLDVGRGPNRWERWRPTVSLFQQEDFALDRLELLYPRQATTLAKQVTEDVAQVSPQTVTKIHLVDPRDPWDFEEVYAALYDFAAAYPFDTEHEEYFVHITTGTHVAQICLFLLAETHQFPAKLVQTSPKFKTGDPAGQYRIIDLDLSKYDAIAARTKQRFKDNVASLKSGIATRNAAFNRLIEDLEHVAAHSVDPILLTGPTGAGKTHLARRIYELKKHRRQVTGPLVEVNCATLRGDGAMSALFGHKKGSFTGASADRAGLMRSADGGVLFLDEIGELGLDEQAMLLRAIEEKRFLPLGADVEVSSSFQLIAGTNRHLESLVEDGRFREDLLARINLWAFRLPALRERCEDIEPNLEFELEQFAKRTGRAVRFSVEAREAYVRFATSPDAAWNGNFRDLAASITRLATLAPAGRVTDDGVQRELTRLKSAWGAASPATRQSLELAGEWCERLLPAARVAELDRFDRVQLTDVLEVCVRSRSLAEASRALFAQSRARKLSSNDSDRLRKYLARFGLTWDAVRAQHHDVGR